MPTPTPLTLPTGPAAHPAMDHAFLRDEGLRLLARLAGDQWTDFNLHDPGVVLLEQLCYAITDLAYRIDHSIPDLFAGSDPIPGPAESLGGDPVTAGDLRRLALDADGVGNAFVEPPAAPELTVFYHRGSQQIRLRREPGETDIRPVELVGLHHVWLQTTDRTSSDVALARVAARLHAARGLCTDLEVAPLATHAVLLQARIEVAAVDDPVDLLADILLRIDAYLAPTPRFTALADALAAGRRVDELCDGPFLARGVLLGDLPSPRRSVRVSDLIHVINDVPAVRAIRSLTLPGEAWTLDIPPGTVPVLDPDAEFILLRAGLKLQVDVAEARRRADRRRPAGAPSVAATSLRPPAGRDRRLAAYRSIRHQLPAAYGVGPLGLPDSAPPLRHAQARQLAAYLHLFDQLLANSFAQLAGARDLLSPGAGRTTYFAGHVPDVPAYLGDPLQALTRDDLEAPEAALARRQRLLNHLLARHAEQIGDYSQIHGADPSAGGWALAAAKAAFLRDYPRLGGARGSGHDILTGDPTSGLADRLRHKLGLRDRPRFHVVEHILLRPIPEDDRQLGVDENTRVPLLSDVLEPDPWSLQVSLVFEEYQGPEPDPDDPFERLVADTILAELPAHLRPQLHWFGDADDGLWTAFDAAWAEFRAAHRDYRRARRAREVVPDLDHLRFRDARDRVVDLLRIGSTYPLRDIPVTDHVIAGFGERAEIVLGYSQRGVVYSLRDRVSGHPVKSGDRTFEAVGTGGPIQLRTPPVEDDTGYRILAIKRDPEDGKVREAWLHTAVRVEGGVDPRIVAQIKLGDPDGPVLLDRVNDNPGPTDARLAAFDAGVTVEILASQKGVTYDLVADDAPTTVVSVAPVVGNSQTVTLRIKFVREDFNIRVRGTKTVSGPAGPQTSSALLHTVLPLRVRANPNIVPAIASVGREVVARLPASQASASYQVFVRRIRDREFVFDDPSPPDTIKVGNIRVCPAPPLTRAELTAGGAVRPGTGGPLDVPLLLTRHVFLQVVATKQHRKFAAGDERIASEVVLPTVLAALVGPAAGDLVITGTLADGAAPTRLEFTGGAPGVFYELFTDKFLGDAYFHQRDDDDPRINKGVDQLRMGVDLALARDRLPGPVDEAGAVPPILDTTGLQFGAQLTICLRGAMTGSRVVLDALPLDPVPPIRVEPAAVAAGASASIFIDAPLVTDRYTLMLGDQIVATAPGTKPIKFTTGPLAGTTQFTVLAERVGRFKLVRRVFVAVHVTP